MASAVLGNSPEPLHRRYSMAYFHAFDDVVIVEFEPEIPIYVVEFHAPGGKFCFARYSVSVYKHGGGVFDFDSANLRSEDHASNHAMEPTASRRTIQLQMSSTGQSAATRAVTRGSFFARGPRGKCSFG